MPVLMSGLCDDLSPHELTAQRPRCAAHCGSGDTLGDAPPAALTALIKTGQSRYYTPDVGRASAVRLTAEPVKLTAVKLTVAFDAVNLTS